MWKAPLSSLVSRLILVELEFRLAIKKTDTLEFGFSAHMNSRGVGSALYKCAIGKPRVSCLLPAD
jgi:hypothetical protein